MTNPIKYQPSYAFSDFQGVQPNTPLPGIQVDAQFDNIEQSIGQTVDALADVRRSDGALQNGVVTKDSLAPGLVDTLTAQTGAAAANAAATSAETSAGQATTAANEAKTYAQLAGAVIYDWGSFHEPATDSQDWGSFH